MVGYAARQPGPISALPERTIQGDPFKVTTTLFFLRRMESPYAPFVVRVEKMKTLSSFGFKC